MSASRPLAGIRVLDFGQYLAGPLVGMMLADMGADVLRVDPPGGPRFNNPAFDMLSRGKRSVTLDLKEEAGKQTAIDLTRRSDVVIENFRPGVMDRLGLGPVELRKAHPDLIYLSLPGFASSDAELANIPAWEAVIAARTGQFTDMGLNRRLMGINPSFTPLTLASAYGAAFGAMSVLFALNARDRLGGDHIEVPLASALFEGLVYNCEQIEDYPDRYKSPREVELERRTAEGLAMDLSFAELSEFLDPFYRTYTCSDGRGFYVVAGSVANHPQRVLSVLGLETLAAELPDFSAYLDCTDWPASWSLRNYPVGADDRERIASAMKAAFKTRPAHEWEALFGAAKAPATTQRSTKDWLHDEHALESGLVLRTSMPGYGPMHQMGNVAWLSGDQVALHKQSCQAANLVEELKMPVREVRERSAQTGGWLDGMKVLDLTNVIAGPTIGSTLARFGAQVTHVQPVDPSVDPWNAVVFGLHAQRGKQSMLLNLRTEQGKSVLCQLLADADIVTINASDQQRDHLRLSPQLISDINPRALLVQLDAFGGPARGPKSDHLGYDDLAQAATGVMVRFGGGADTAEEHAHFGTIDVLTGFCACAALGAALVQQRRTGRSDVARASLAAAGNLIQAQFMYDYADRAPFDEPAGREVKGWGPFYRCYEARDQWLFLAAPAEGRDLLARVPELAGLETLGDGELEDAIAQRIRQYPLSHWKDAIAYRSTTVVGLASLHGTRDEALQSESEGEIDINKATFRAVRHDQHPMGRWVDLVAPNAVRPKNAEITIPGPASKYGKDTIQLLQQLKHSKAAIEEMLRNGDAATQWSDRYLPE